MKHPPHDSAITHVQGSSEFIDDRPEMGNELLVGIVPSPVAHGKILKIDFSKCREVPGVVACFSGRDFHLNLWGPIFLDQPILASELAQYHSEPIGIIAATHPDALREAKRRVVVKYEEHAPILTIAAARDAKSFVAPARTIERGQVEEALKNAPRKISGVLEIAGQEHFYLEPQSNIAYPGENGQIHIHSSSQHPSEVQHSVAHALGLKQADVVCTVKRMGGAFGGKETQATPFAAMVGLVAQKTGRPARLILNRDEDMLMTGKRNPFEVHYDVGFDENGKLLALDTRLFSNSGAYADLSTSIMERAMLHSDNAYYIPHVRIRGQVCKTHTAPSTAFRGFGGPKGISTMEGILEDIAQALKKDALDVRKANVYQGENNKTPYGQSVTDEILPELFREIEQSADYRARRRAVEEFNRESSTHVRGLSITAVKFGIAFTTRFLNQGSALVNLHLDGTCQVSTGATEMGQGVNVKIGQVVAEELGLPYPAVRVMPTSTEKNHNTSPTAASSGADINGAAARMAAQRIKRRLQEIAKFYYALDPKLRGKMPAVLGLKSEATITDDAPEDPDIVFADGRIFSKSRADFNFPLVAILEEAYLNRVSLGAYGYYRYEGIHLNKDLGQGSPFYYFTNGVACSEVQIERLTGETKVLRADILMDLGRPLNEGIDYGQTTGAFVQGMGWVTTERLFTDEKGVLLTHAPSTYKIPSIQDTPRVFNVKFWVNDKNEKNLKGSKAVGEPPLMLGISVWTAIKNALSYCAAAQKFKASGALRIPASQEEILMLISQ